MRQFDDDQITMTKHRLQTGLNLEDLFPNRGGQTENGEEHTSPINVYGYSDLTFIKN